MQQFVDSRVVDSKAQIKVLQAEITDLEAQGKKTETATELDG